MDAKRTFACNVSTSLALALAALNRMHSLSLWHGDTDGHLTVQLMKGNIPWRHPRSKGKPERKKPVYFQLYSLISRHRIQSFPKHGVDTCFQFTLMGLAHWPRMWEIMFNLLFCLKGCETRSVQASNLVTMLVGDKHDENCSFSSTVHRQIQNYSDLQWNWLPQWLYIPVPTVKRKIWSQTSQQIFNGVEIHLNMYWERKNRNSCLLCPK